MTMKTHSRRLDFLNSSGNAFIARFMLLSVIGGLTIGMGKVVTTFFALHVGATSSQVGFIAGVEAVGRMLVTVPAGFIIARRGARIVYSISSLVPMALNAVTPWLSLWYVIALTRGAIGLSIPFRVVAMNSAFLQQLSTLGASRAGWYRGSQSLGMTLLGPLLGGLLVQHGSYWGCYLLIAVLFAVMAIFGNSFMPNAEAVAAEPPAGDGQGMWSQSLALLRDRTIRDSCLIEAIGSSTVSLFSTFILLLAIDVLGVSQSLAVMLLVVQGITTVVVSFTLGFLVSGVARNVVQPFSFAMMVAGLLVIGMANAYLLVALGAVLLSAGGALIGLARTLQLSRMTISKGKISGVFNLATMGGTAFGAVAGGVLAELVGLRGLFLSWIPLVIAAALFCRLRMEASTPLGQRAGP